MSSPEAESAVPALIGSMRLVALPTFKPEMYDRAWVSVPHPTMPVIATAHKNRVIVFSLSTLSQHSSLTSGHSRSVRSVAWKPNLGTGKMCLATGSFDSTAALWRWEEEETSDSREIDVGGTRRRESDDQDEDWQFTLVLEGHDSEVKSVAFSPGGQYLATCSRDKSVWIWEDVGANEADDEWETVAVLNDHEADVKAVAWCPETTRAGRGRYSSDALASASYDETVRIWRQDEDGEWVCMAVLEGHQGTVWGLQWEPKTRSGQYPRLMTWSADQTIRVWTLKQDEDDEEEQVARPAWGGLGSVPNTMRRSLQEEWECTAVLPPVHTRYIYSASWSAETGLVASTGSDSIIAVYQEAEEMLDKPDDIGHATHAEAAAELDGDDAHLTNGYSSEQDTPEQPRDSKKWKVLTKRCNGHGPYEINHITWCKRYDSACPPEKRGIEEMLVSTGDDGTIRPWQISYGEE